MIKKFINQVVDAISAPQPGEADSESREAALRSATAVLMLDVARADHVFDESEFERVLDLVETHFGISPEDAAELVNADSTSTKTRLCGKSATCSTSAAAGACA